MTQLWNLPGLTTLSTVCFLVGSWDIPTFLTTVSIGSFLRLIRSFVGFIM